MKIILKKLWHFNSIKLGDIIEIKAGEKVPVDGKITKGEGFFDESTLTGESIPRIIKNLLIQYLVEQ